MSRLCVSVVPRLVLAATAAVLALPSQANANFSYRGGFVFEEMTEFNDPVNLLFAGGRASLDACKRSDQPALALYSEGCVEDLVADNVEDMATRGRCEALPGGTDHLRFKRTGNRVEQAISQSTDEDCGTQYHFRGWTDEDVDNPPGQFAVGNAHHEFRPTRGSRHRVDQYEAAEVLVTFDIFQAGYCVYGDWRVVPGQPTGRLRRYGGENDGRISRITQQKRDTSQPSGSRCAGA